MKNNQSHQHGTVAMLNMTATCTERLAYWCKEHNVSYNPEGDLHCTLLFSRTPVESLMELDGDKCCIKAKPIGWKKLGKSLSIELRCPQAYELHCMLIKAGGTHGVPEFNCHTSVDPNYQGELPTQLPDFDFAYDRMKVEGIQPRFLANSRPVDYVLEAFRAERCPDLTQLKQAWPREGELEEKREAKNPKIEYQLRRSYREGVPGTYPIGSTVAVTHDWFIHEPISVSIRLSLSVLATATPKDVSLHARVSIDGHNNECLLSCAWSSPEDDDRTAKFVTAATGALDVLKNSPADETAVVKNVSRALLAVSPDASIMCEVLDRACE